MSDSEYPPSSLGLRHFSPQVEEIAKRWRENPVERQEIREIRPVDRKHATSPWWVELTQDKFEAVLKPGQHALIDQFADDHAELSEVFQNNSFYHVQSGFIPAIEKIAADLAFYIDLPIAPVALYYNPNATDQVCRKACLSLKSFDTEQRHIKELVPDMKIDQLGRFFTTNSAMAIFKGWFQNTDTRTSNIVFEKETYESAYVDFSVSSLFHWIKPAGPRAKYMTDSEVMVAPVAQETLKKIQGLPESIIIDTVNNVPDDYLDKRHKEIFTNGLLYRQENLHKLLSKDDYKTTIVNSGEEGARYIRRKMQERSAFLSNDFG